VSKSEFESLQLQVRTLQQHLKTKEDFEKQFQSAAFKKAVQAEINSSLTDLNTYINDRLKELFDKKLENDVKKYMDKFAKKHNNQA